MVALRIDDFGASSKRYEWHRHKLRAYSEVAWQGIDELARYLFVRGWSATLAITACWVERDGALTPYHVKYPHEAGSVHYWVRRGVFEVACHGLTHCVPGHHVRPWWRLRSNRAFHREYVDDLIPAETQREYLARAKAMLEDRFGVRVVTFVPPGNAVSPWMVEWATSQLGFEIVTCRTPYYFGATCQERVPGILDDRAYRTLHDRDLFAGVERAVGVPPAGESFGAVHHVYPGRGMPSRA